MNELDNKSQRLKVITHLSELGFKLLSDYTGFKDKIKIKCNKCGEEQDTTYYNIKRNSQCKNCKKNQIEKEKKEYETLNIEIRKKAKKFNFKINDWFDKIPIKVNIYCRKCNHKFETDYSKIGPKLKCSKCAQSEKEQEIKYKLIEQIILSAVNNSNLKKENFSGNSLELEPKYKKHVLEFSDFIKLKSYQTATFNYDSSKDFFIKLDEDKIIATKDNILHTGHFGSFLSLINMKLELSSDETSLVKEFDGLSEKKYFNSLTEDIYKLISFNINPYNADMFFKNSGLSSIFVQLSGNSLSICDLSKIKPPKIIKLDLIKTNETSKIIFKFDNNIRLEYQLSKLSEKTEISSIYNLIKETIYFVDDRSKSRKTKTFSQEISISK